MPNRWKTPASAPRASDAARPEHQPATPRHAATVIVLDAGAAAPASPHVLLGRRRATARFMPSALVFPGGGVDPADAAAPHATPPDPLTLAHLCRGAAEPMARAILAAAARELEEETGLSLGTPPALHGLRYLCRAITPADRHIRFDARFFVLDAAELAARAPGFTLLERGELEDLAWHALDDTWGYDLPIPTRGALAILRTRLCGQTPWPAEPAAKLPILRNGATYEWE